MLCAAQASKTVKNEKYYKYIVPSTGLDIVVGYHANDQEMWASIETTLLLNSSNETYYAIISPKNSSVHANLENRVFEETNCSQEYFFKDTTMQVRYLLNLRNVNTFNVHFRDSSSTNQSVFLILKSPCHLSVI